MKCAIIKNKNHVMIKLSIEIEDCFLMEIDKINLSNSPFSPKTLISIIIQHTSKTLNIVTPAISTV